MGAHDNLPMISTLPADESNPLGRAPKIAAAANTQRPVHPPQQRPLESYSSESSANAIASDSPSNYSSFSSSDSDEPLPGAPNEVNEVDEDDALDVVGVSIGREQSRMKARATPAEEKNRVLEQQGGYFTNIPDEFGEDGLFVSELTAEPDSVEPEAARAEETLEARRVTRSRPTHPVAPAVPVERHAQRDPHRNNSVPLPSSLRDSKDSSASGSRTSFTRSLLKTSLPRRPRAWSGELKKFLPDLTSLTKRPTLPFLSPNANNRARSQTAAASIKRSQSTIRACSLDRRHSPTSSTANGIANDEDDVQPISELRKLDGSSAVKHSFTRRPSVVTPGRPPSLRRSSSDQSLYLRASSTASSLEQRPRYENVHSQVNSRFKAIKDSLQDSSSRLLSMPSLHLQDIRTDWASLPFPSATRVMTEQWINGSAQRSATPPPPPRYNPQSTHPILEEAMSELTGDVVILGGYRGSILRSAKAPHRQLWVPVKVGLNLRKVDLEVGLTREDEERMEEKIIPSGVLSHIGPVDVCRRLMKRLRKCNNAVRGDLRVWDYGYDWRLSPDLLSQRLITFLEGLPCNRPTPDGETQSPRRGAIVIAHSLGGLITRHAVNKRPDLFAGVVYAGVPQHCVNILGPLRNGDDVLLSSRVLTAQVNFTFRTSYALLPEDGHCFIDKQTKEEYRVDFFDVNTWDEHHLSPCIKPALPAVPANTRFKDFTVLSKRFSMGPRDGWPDLNTQDPPDNSDPNSSTTNDDQHNQSTRNPRRSAQSLPNPAQAAAAPTEKVNDTLALSGVDSLVGPGAMARNSTATNQATSASTIPRAAAIEYLSRTLAEVKRFKSELAFQPTHQAENRYPPAAVLYGKSVPTLYGARVSSREAIKHQDAYDDLAFAAGDGVCLASAAMLPAGYRVIRNGLVKSDRGHVGLLGDLEGVGQCLRAVIRGRKEGVGSGSLQK